MLFTRQSTYLARANFQLSISQSWSLERFVQPGQNECLTTIYHTNITKKSVNSFCSNKFIMTSRLPLTKKPQVLIFYYSTVLSSVVRVGKVMWEVETLHVYTTVYYVNNVLSEINKLSSYQLDWDRQTQQYGQQRQAVFVCLDNCNYN